MPGKSVRSLVDVREEAACLPLGRLEAEITQLAGHIAAGECRWLLLVAEFDRRDGWQHWGCKSCVHWLGWQCGLDERSARERVRVARALLEFTTIRNAFSRGTLSYSKVRAITRVATPETEADLVSIARHATAAQVERLVAGYRRAFDPRRLAEAELRHQRMELNWVNDDDGTFVVQSRLDPEDGAILRGVIEAVMERSIRERPSEPGESLAARRAQALVEIAILAGANDAVPLATADRHLVVLNVDATVLAGNEGERCELDGGPGLAAETARRIACDASFVRVVRGPQSEILDIGRKSRVIPRGMRRALHARDQGCRFPGCGERRIVDGHHVEHWTHDGETELTNLVELCAFHHRLVHEGGWQLNFERKGTVTFIRPDGVALADESRAGGSAEPPVECVEEHHRRRGLAISPQTIVPDWWGDHLDLDSALMALAPRGSAEPVG